MIRSLRSRCVCKRAEVGDVRKLLVSVLCLKQLTFNWVPARGEPRWTCAHILQSIALTDCGRYSSVAAADPSLLSLMFCGLFCKFRKLEIHDR